MTPISVQSASAILLIVLALTTAGVLVIANLMHPPAKLLARQNSFMPSVPPECASECSDYTKYLSGCSDANNSNATAAYECVCTPAFFGDAITCGNCAPAVFANMTGISSLDDYIQEGLSKCQEAGFPLALPNTSSTAIQATPTTRSANNTGDLVAHSADLTLANGMPEDISSPPIVTASSDVGTIDPPASASSVSIQGSSGSSRFSVTPGLASVAFIAGFCAVL